MSPPATRVTQQFRSGTIGLCWLIVSLPIACTGCRPAGTDSWRHYTSGGSYAARTPSMSPNGSVIAFSSPRSGNGDIYQINSDGSGPIRLTTDPSFETDPIFSPDGLIIAFAREANGCRHVWLMDRDGTDQRQLTSGSVIDDVWSFTPDGTELLLTRSPVATGLGMGRSIEYIALNLHSKDVRKLDGFQVYSPDGKKIACSSYNLASKHYEIRVMDADGSNKRFLTTGGSPCFSPDGGTILYSTEVEVDAGSLWNMISIDGSNDRQLGHMADPVFTTDGKHVVYLSPSYQREIWKMDVDGTNRTRLVAPKGYIDFFRPCHRGFVLKLDTGDRVGDIYVIDTDAWTVEHIASMN